MEFDVTRGLDVGSPVVVGQRKIYVVSEVLSIKSRKGIVFGILVSPIALLVFERNQLYTSSFVRGSEVSIEELIAKEPSLEEKLSSELIVLETKNRS